MTLAVFLWVYIAFVAIIFLYALLNLYHILRYGRFDAPTYFMTGLFVAGFIFIVFVSFVFISGVDWATPIPFFSSSPNSFLQ